jgi:uncharacterized membrane protein YidH (DUF202 family)
MELIDDPGRQPERTALAWERTALAVAVTALATVRLAAHSAPSPVIIVASVTLAAAGGILALGHYGYRRVTHGPGRHQLLARLATPVAPVAAVALVGIANAIALLAAGIDPA